MLWNWLTTAEHSSNASMQETMKSASQLRGHLERIELMQKNILAHPLPDSVAQAKILTDIKTEVARIIKGDATYVAQVHHAVLPSIQNLHDSYTIQHKKHLDLQRDTFLEQQVIMKNSLLQHSKENKQQQIGDDSPLAEDTLELSDSLDLTGTGSTAMSNEMKTNDMSEVRMLLERRIDFQQSDYSDFLHKCKLTTTVTGGLEEKTVYSQMVSLFIINTRTALTSSLKRGLADTLDYFAKENSIGIIFSQPENFDYWRSIFADATAKDKKWYWINTLVLLPEVVLQVSAPKLRTVAEHCLVFSRKKSVDVNMPELLNMYANDAGSFNTNIVHNVKVTLLFMIMSYYG